MSKLSFTVFGTPAPQGSMKAFMPKGGRFPVVTADNAKTKPWRQQIAGTALAEIARSGFEPLMTHQGILLIAVFYFAKPKSRKDGRMVTKPDIDKLLRALLDSMTGIVFRDDSQIDSIISRKEYGLPARVEIEIM